MPGSASSITARMDALAFVAERLWAEVPNDLELLKAVTLPPHYSFQKPNRDPRPESACSRGRPA